MGEETGEKSHSDFNIFEWDLGKGDRAHWELRLGWWGGH